VYNNKQCLSSTVATFVNALSVGGYETVLSGRMHFVGWDQHHGFEKRFVGDITPCFTGGSGSSNFNGVLQGTSGQTMAAIKNSGAGNSAVLDFDSEVTDATCTFLEHRKDERPLFLTVGFYGPHCPYVAPRDLFDYYYGILDDTPFLGPDEKQSMHPAIRQWYANRSLDGVTLEDVKRVRAAYYSMVETMDTQFGKILETIEQTLGFENTLIIYGADHGDNIGEHGLFWKTNFYEGASRVPLICSYEGVIPANTHICGVTSLLDIAPTLIEFAQAPELPLYDGQSLFGVLKGEQEISPEREVVSFCSDIKGDAPSAMIRRGSFKLIKYAGYEHPQLFDIDRDPQETNDLGTNLEYGQVVESLLADLKSYWDEEKEMENLRQAKQHVKLMRNWFDMVNPAGVGEWKDFPQRSFLEK
jgi:choline-sulfatase